MREPVLAVFVERIDAGYKMTLVDRGERHDLFDASLPKLIADAIDYLDRRRYALEHAHQSAQAIMP